MWTVTPRCRASMVLIEVSEAAISEAIDEMATALEVATASEIAASDPFACIEGVSHR